MRRRFFFFFDGLISRDVWDLQCAARGEESAAAARRCFFGSTIGSICVAGGAGLPGRFPAPWRAFSFQYQHGRLRFGAACLKIEDSGLGEPILCCFIGKFPVFFSPWVYGDALVAASAAATKSRYVRSSA